MDTKVVLEFYSQSPSSETLCLHVTSDLLNHTLWATLPFRLCGRIMFCGVLLATGVSRVRRRVAQVAALPRKQNPVGSIAGPQSGSVVLKHELGQHTHALYC